MSKKARSARGELVDFDVLAIKQQLAAKPVPVSVNERRQFIDEKDGLKARTVAHTASALSVAMDGVDTSAKSAAKK